MADRKGDWMQTYTGKRFWPLDPRPEEIDVLDVAHGLSQLCRFGGQCNEFYSVAQHSILVSKIVRSDQALAGLFHDSPEAYIQDIVSPLKKFLPPEFKEIENNIQETIFKHFNIVNYDHAHIKEADKTALMTEMRDIMSTPPQKWNEDGLYTPLKEITIPLKPKYAEELFLKRYEKLIRRE